MYKVNRIEFLGNYFWLWFWLIIFFPIGFAYFALRSAVLREQVQQEEFEEWRDRVAMTQRRRQNKN